MASTAGHPNELVALHTQSLPEPYASTWVDLQARAMRTARLNNTFADRRRIQHSLEMMAASKHRGVYDRIYIDARTGLPNMASFTRVQSDYEVAERSLSELHGQAELDRRGQEAAVFAELANKRRYLEALRARAVANIDEHRVQLRRHDPETGTAMFRIDLTKLDATGTFIRVTIELTQVSSAWRRSAIAVDAAGDSAAASEVFHATVYRYAAFDAESLFIHMHDIEGVSVDRVQRGVIGPALISLPHEGGVVCPVEVAQDPLGATWAEFVGTGPTKPELLFSFQTDIAARDVREEKNNDPIEPLLRERIEAGERPRYERTRERFPFKVFKDRKFVVTDGVRPVVENLCKQAGTRNLVYRLSARRQTS